MMTAMTWANPFHESVFLVKQVQRCQNIWRYCWWTESCHNWGYKYPGTSDVWVFPSQQKVTRESHLQRKRLILSCHPFHCRLYCHRRFLSSWSIHFCKCSNLRRAWCIFESYVCIDSDFPITIILPERARRFLVNFEIETLAQGTDPKCT